MNKSKMISAFDRAAETYDDYGFVQQDVAKRLARFVPDEMFGKALEIGCGTGFLSKELIEKFPNLDWTMSDISPKMIEKCRQNIGDQARFMVLDGEHPNIEGQYDLIISNLAFQWFKDLSKTLSSLNNLLSDNGYLYFSTLGNKSFQEWRDYLDKENLNHGLHQYPSYEDLKSYNLDVEVNERVFEYENTQSFVKSLKSIGANTPNSLHKPIQAGAFRNLLRKRDNNQTFAVTYEIYFCKMGKS